MGSVEEHQQLVSDIINFAGALPNVRVWPRVVGVGRALKTNNVIRYGLMGESDIDGIIAPLGKRLSIEVKTGKAIRTPQQKRFAEMIIKFGGLYVLARSMDDVIEAFKQEGIISD